MTKSEEMKNRALKVGRLFIQRDATIRSVADVLLISKSTVHKDLHRLKEVHNELYEKCIDKIEFHKKVRGIRGAEATRKMYEKRKKNDNK